MPGGGEGCLQGRISLDASAREESGESCRKEEAANCCSSLLAEPPAALCSNEIPAKKIFFSFLLFDKAPIVIAQSTKFIIFIGLLSHITWRFMIFVFTEKKGEKCLQGVYCFICAGLFFV